MLDIYSADDVSTAKTVLLEAVSHELDKPLSRYPERQSTDRTVREMDDVMDILVHIDERKLLSALPIFVADNSDNLSSLRMDVGEMHIILNKIYNLEAILFGVQKAVYIRMIIDQANAAAESNGRFLSASLYVSKRGAYYGRPLSVSGRPCYILPMFFLNFFYGRLIIRPWLTEVRENFTRGRP